MASILLCSNSKTMEKTADIKEKWADIISCSPTHYRLSCCLSMSSFPQKCWPPYKDMRRDTGQPDIDDIQQTPAGKTACTCFNSRMKGRRKEGEEVNRSYCQCLSRRWLRIFQWVFNIARREVSDLSKTLQSRWPLQYSKVGVLRCVCVCVALAIFAGLPATPQCLSYLDSISLVCVCIHVHVCCWYT